MLINTADGMAATVLAGEPATVQFVSPRSTSVTFEAIREHMCASLFVLPHLSLIHIIVSVLSVIGAECFWGSIHSEPKATTMP